MTAVLYRNAMRWQPKLVVQCWVLPNGYLQRFHVFFLRSWKVEYLSTCLSISPCNATNPTATLLTEWFFENVCVQDERKFPESQMLITSTGPMIAKARVSDAVKRQRNVLWSKYASPFCELDIRAHGIRRSFVFLQSMWQGSAKGKGAWRMACPYPSKHHIPFIYPIPGRNNCWYSLNTSVAGATVLCYPLLDP